jgi:hypothetical protein
LRIKVEQGTVGQNDDVRFLRLLLEVRREPLQLLVADQRAGSDTLSSAMKCTPLWSNV